MDALLVKALITLLLDRGADISARDDAAMDLYAVDDEQARQALLTVAIDPETPEMVQASAGESLGQIAARTGRALSDEERTRLTPAASWEYEVFQPG
ncbi:hypothetical protein [Streptomyces hydrogenans]|uniref:Ankyrin repeat domain-containing protein n=1 Tax=Streptomyces hydrogenans TaxID=1873719 RepID=A0ABQ3PKW1_9ACTN|nr:hypothetical protein [Streptomyces hydrogenans]GHG20436.1 hypothetical protein GCM10018784_37160 [Streptomyces hydrogenans]GHI23120.1 hypothetical protein Shyd_44910 [Streptomyces hydrogenans]GHI25650.1 hypothetical protein Shyd_70210 [Streptomyces hydrogenans]GHI25662.1 hypothetical protein Shyd_70330 [Streptomyces hydrogenans]